jgi:hypothetical protein
VTSALVGYTGFVGSTLKRFNEYTDLFNSSNFREMSGRSFDEVVCAGVSAVKWLANQKPEDDWKNIKALLDVLSSVNTRRFVLISTIDVYPDPSASCDEDTILSTEEGQPYGRHRLLIEEFASEKFEDVLIARLPALFGPGLKKNALFDLMNDNQIDKINPSSVFQWYPVERLANDLQTATAADLKLVNLFPEPIATSRIVEEVFPDAKVANPSEPAPRYSLRTRHAETFGGRDGFIMNQQAVLDEICRYVERERGGR